jgi:excisionase family DNA binding protein
MPLNMKEAAQLLGVSESRVRGYIATGKLTGERKGRQVQISETELKRFAETQKGFETCEHEIHPGSEPVPPASHADVLEHIDGRLAALEARLNERWQMVKENQHLQQLLREHDLKLAEKDLEVQKLRRDLVYQKRLADKELEDHRLAFQERLTRVEQEAAERRAQEGERLEQALERERERMEEALSRERQLCSEKLALEQQRLADMLTAMRNQEGFLARLMRMITWS